MFQEFWPVGLRNDDIYTLYEIYESYIKDLLISKKLNISVIIDNEIEEKINSTINQIISATNSAFMTIGVSKTKITPNQDLFQDYFLRKRKIFTDYISFIRLSLKDYINRNRRKGK